MKNINFVILLILLVVSSVLFADGVMPEGFGTEVEPYLIANLDNLLYLSTNDALWVSGLYFSQTTDIDAVDTQNWNDGAGFSPIGDYLNEDYSRTFCGNYNGNEHTIDGLYINRFSTNYIGLFGYTIESTIQNLSVNNVNITGQHLIGGLVGMNEASTISDCYSTGNVSGTGSVGGLVGTNFHSTVSNSYSNGSANGTEDLVGGFVGLNYDSTVSNCYSTGSVSGSGDYIGGLTGYNCSNSTVSNCYSTGNVSGTGDYIGGLVGDNIFFSTISHSFWDIETSNQTTSAGGIGKTTIEMQTQATYTDWDFAEIWQIAPELNNGYPYLVWQDFNTAIEEETIALSSSSITKLRNIYPNPFNPNTSVSFYLAENTKVTLEIYNIKGAKVKVLVNENMLGRTEYRFNWNGKSADGKDASSGIYLFKMKAGNKVQTAKATLIK